jgi:hypothetical protein
MKKFYYLLLAAGLFTSQAKAQQIINFEATGTGANYGWNVFENATNPALEFIENPVAGGINNSPTVAKFTALPAGQPYAGTETQVNAITPFMLTTNNCVIKIMVYKTVISPVGIKLVHNGGALPEIKVSNTLVNQWEELTFNFSGQIDAFTTPVDQIVVFPDFATRTTANVVYFDNITFGIGEPPTPVAQPLTAAPAPTLPAAQVISLFSEVYPGISMGTWLTNWSVASHTEVMIQNNATKRYSNLDYAGIEPGAQINATGMNYFNIDVWSSNFTQLRIKLVDFGPDGGYDGPNVPDDSEFELTYATPAQNQWIHYSIPLTAFTGMNRANIAQLILSSNGTSTVYFDNIYFSTDQTTAGTKDFAAGSVVMYPNPVKDQLVLESASVIERVSVYNTLGQQVMTAAPGTVTATLNVEKLQSGVYMISLYANGGVATRKFIKE